MVPLRNIKGVLSGNLYSGHCQAAHSCFVGRDKGVGDGNAFGEVFTAVSDCETVKSAADRT